MENPEQAFVEYASSRTDEAGGLVSEFMASQDARLSKFEADFKRQQDPQCSTQIHSSINAITIHPKQPEESQVNKPKSKQEEDNPGDTNSNLHPQPDPLASIAIEQVLKLNLMLESLGMVPQSSNMKFVYSKEDDGECSSSYHRDVNDPNRIPNKGEGQ
ncbi:hypothetical protein Tco_1401419 [Tanacetum coccineum]